MRPALLLCLLSVVIVSSQGRRSRRDLLVPPDDKDAASHPASPTDLVAAADSSSGSRKSPSLANSPPNSWLYKFPPWFLPGNPTPDRFHSTHGMSQAAAKEFSMVDDGDVLIIDNFGIADRTGRLGNVRVPGNSAFRDEIVQTVLNVKYGRSQSPSSLGSNADTRGVSGQVVTPWLVPQSVPEPPRPSPTPTVPITLQQGHGGDAGFDNNLVTGRPQGKHEVVITSPRPTNGDDFLSKDLRTDSLPSDVHKFQPSPPDVYQTSRPFNAAQGGQTSVGISGFRPSKPISVALGSQGSLQHSNAGVVTGPTVVPQGHNNENNIRHNNNFLKAQQAALLKASDRPQSLGHQSLGDGRRNPQSTTGQGKHRAIPFLPGVPLPLLLQYNRQLSQTGRRQPSPQVTSARLQHHQRSGRENLPGIASDLRQQQQRFGSAPLPTSIQDIINSDYDTAQSLYPAGGDPGVPVTGDRKPTSAGGRDGDNQWLWRTS